jgi:hypothetical protein
LRFERWLHKHYPRPRGLPRDTLWVFEMRLYLRCVYPRGEEGVFESTATGDYKYCLFDLAAELADWATEPFIKLEIRIRPVAAE